MTGGDPDGGRSDGTRSDGGESSAVVVDARGKLCPLPVIELARRLGDVEVGAVVELWADDPAADPDVRAWCRMRQQEFAGTRPAPHGTGSVYLVRRQH